MGKMKDFNRKWDNQSGMQKNVWNAGERRNKRKQIALLTGMVLLIGLMCSTIFAFAATTLGNTQVAAADQGTDNSGSLYTEAIDLGGSGADDNMRGIWVATAYSFDFPSTVTTNSEALKKDIDRMLDNIAAMGMNCIFLQVRPTADAFYPSAYFPWSKYLTGKQGTPPADSFDPLEYWVSGAHNRGMELHAWINPYAITKKESDWDAMSADNPAKNAYSQYVIKYNNNYYFDPAEPQVRQLIINGALEIINNYDVDGIQLDDYFYPGKDFADDASYVKYGAGKNKADWRRENVNALVREMGSQLHAADKDVRFGVSVQGIWANSTTISTGSKTRGQEAYTEKFADAVTWIKNGWMDYVAPQIYWNIGYSIADYKVVSDWWTNVVLGTDVDLYVGMADYKASGVTDTTSAWYGTSELRRQLDLNQSNSAVKGEIHFRYKKIIEDSAIIGLYKEYYGKQNVNGGSGTSAESVNTAEIRLKAIAEKLAAGSFMPEHKVLLFNCILLYNIYIEGR